MRIGVFTDLRFVRSSTPTGVGKHIEQMVGGLARDPLNEVFLLAASDQYLGPGIQWPAAGRELEVRRLPLPWKAAEALWTLCNGPAADSLCGNADWVYCPKNDFIPLRSTKLAVTVHGAHELDPLMPRHTAMKARLNRLRRGLSYRRITSAATVVLTVSQFLKRQIVEWFECDPEKIAVVGNGVEQCYFDAADLPVGVSGRSPDRPYVLSVGGLNDLDGAGLTLDVAEGLARADPSVRLVVVGAQNDPSFVDRARALSNIELVGYVRAERLAALMKDARALLYLPRYETFGIAAAEAMAVGTPVITTGATAIPEVVGDAAMVVSPVVKEVVEGVLKFVGDGQLRRAFASAGRVRAGQFSWAACVDRLRDAIRVS